MEKNSLLFRLFDPNPIQISADGLLTVLLEANTDKLMIALSDCHQNQAENDDNPRSEGNSP